MAEPLCNSRGKRIIVVSIARSSVLSSPKSSLDEKPTNDFTKRALLHGWSPQSDPCQAHNHSALPGLPVGFNGELAGESLRT